MVNAFFFFVKKKKKFKHRSHQMSNPHTQKYFIHITTRKENMSFAAATTGRRKPPKTAAPPGAATTVGGASKNRETTSSSPSSFSFHCSATCSHGMLRCARVRSCVFFSLFLRVYFFYHKTRPPARDMSHRFEHRDRRRERTRRWRRVSATAAFFAR